MEVNQHTYRNIVRYTLRHKTLKSIEIDEPEGWEKSETVFKKAKDYDGIFLDLQSQVTFSGNGAKRINEVYEIGIKEKLQLIKDIKHPTKDIWTNVYSSFISLKSRKLIGGKVTVNLNSSSLQQLLKSKESEQIELDRLDDLNGNPIPPLKTETLISEGRDINLISDSKYQTGAHLAKMDGSTQGTGHSNYQCILSELVSQSDDNFHAQTSVDFKTNYVPVSQMEGRTSNMFFINDTEDTLDLTFDINFFAELKFTQGNDDHPISRDMRIVLLKFKNGLDYDNMEIVQDLYQFQHTFVPNEVYTNTFEINSKISVTVEPGESLSIASKSFRGSSINFNTMLQEELQPVIFKIHIERNSFFKTTTFKFITAYQEVKRILLILTGRDDILQSEALTTGVASMTGVTHGFWVRGFDKEPQDDSNKFKSYTTSLKEARQSYFALWNLKMGINKVGYKEYVTMEERDGYYNKNVGAKLKDLVDYDDIEVTTAEKYIYSGFEFGYKKGGKYEAIHGLDEPNTKTTMPTTIDVLKNIYKAVSPYRSDSYGLEQVRRKQREQFPTTDTPFDNDKFLLDTIQSGTHRRHAKWQNHYEAKPTGIFSPNTATELRHSPMQMMLRHSKYISSGFIKYPNDYVRYGGSVGNSKMTTRLQGGVDISENGDIKNSDLGKSRFVPTYFTFPYNIGFDLIETIKGTTIVNGKEIQNKNALIEVPTTKGNFKGFLEEVRVDKNEIKILIANI